MKGRLQIAGLLIAGALVGSGLTAAAYNRYEFKQIGDRGYFYLVTDRLTGAVLLHRMYKDTVVTTDFRSGSQWEYRTKGKYER